MPGGNGRGGGDPGSSFPRNFTSTLGREGGEYRSCILPSGEIDVDSTGFVLSPSKRQIVHESSDCTAVQNALYMFMLLDTVLRRI